MAGKKNKKQQIVSESSDEDMVDGITTPHGPAARDWTHQGGNFKGTCTQGRTSPLATGKTPWTSQFSPVTGHQHVYQTSVGDTHAIGVHNK